VVFLFIVRGYLRLSNGSVVMDVRGEDLWGEVSLPRGSRTTGLAISTPHGCVIVIGVDALMGGEKVLIASFLDPLDPATLGIIEGASKSRRISLARDGAILGTLDLSESDLEKMEYVASKTRECMKMQDKPVNLELAAQWFIENFNL
jgi:hypothetical protein